MSRIAVRVLVAVTAMLALPAAAAGAATLNLNGTTLTVTGAETTDNISMSMNGTDMEISDYPNQLVAPAPCTQSGNNVRCPDGTFTTVIANLGGGEDSYKQYIRGIADTVSGGAGNDDLTGAVAGDLEKPATDTISGDAGDDELGAGSGSGTVCNGGDGKDYIRCFYVPAGGTSTTNGGPGVDDIVGGDSNDTLNGDAGNDDRISGGKGDDVINGGDGDDGTSYLYGGLDGGDGADQISGGAGVDELSEERNEQLTQYWSLDDQPNDGRDADGNGTADEGDNVHSDVENIETDYDNSVIVGSAANNKITTGIGDDRIEGLGGDDDLFTGITGPDYADGGAGNDKVQGNGQLIGGIGNDQLVGQSDNDLIEPGAGLDSVSAGSGNDVVRSADGETDTIGCGVGADIAEVDQLDVVNTKDDGDNCEQVKVTQAATPGPPTPQDTGGNPNATAVQLILGKTGTLKGSVAKFTATVPGPGKISAKVTALGAKASMAKAALLGKTTKTVAGASKVTLKVKLKGKAAKKLKRKKSFKVKLTTVFTPFGGKAQPAVSRTVKLKRK